MAPPALWPPPGLLCLRFRTHIRWGKRRESDQSCRSRSVSQLHPLRLRRTTRALMKALPPRRLLGSTLRSVTPPRVRLPTNAVVSKGCDPDLPARFSRGAARVLFREPGCADRRGWRRGIGYRRATNQRPTARRLRCPWASCTYVRGIDPDSCSPMVGPSRARCEQRPLVGIEQPGGLVEAPALGRASPGRVNLSV